MCETCIKNLWSTFFLSVSGYNQFQWVSCYSLLLRWSKSTHYRYFYFFISSMLPIVSPVFTIQWDMIEYDIKFELKASAIVCYDNDGEWKKKNVSSVVDCLDCLSDVFVLSCIPSVWPFESKQLCITEQEANDIGFVSWTLLQFDICVNFTKRWWNNIEGCCFGTELLLLAMRCFTGVCCVCSIYNFTP